MDNGFDGIGKGKLMVRGEIDQIEKRGAVEVFLNQVIALFKSASVASLLKRADGCHIIQVHHGRSTNTPNSASGWFAAMQPEAPPGEDMLNRFCSRSDPLDTPFTLAIVAHPDDEVIGLGGRIPWLKRLIFVHVTDGAPLALEDARRAGCGSREEYAALRRRELRAALALAGIESECCLELKIADQEVSYHLEELSIELGRLIRSLSPELVLTHAYEGGHPDHDATSFAVHQALSLLKTEPELRIPILLEFALYNGIEGAELHPFVFIPFRECGAQEVVLSDMERELKKEMVACFGSQLHFLGRFPIEIERFRRSPHYNFTQPPHPGRLFYDYFNWGMTGDRWRQLARRALRDLNNLNIRS